MTKYSSFRYYFAANCWNPAVVCPPGPPTLSTEERELVAAALQQLQLGEGSDGQGLRRRAKQYAERMEIKDLAEAMEQFIGEEQRHSAVLGLFLERERLPLLRHHWVDQWFRKIRNLAGFELMLVTLTSAELLAIPFYQTLHDVTKSSTLKAIASQILRDEERHLEFQAENLAQCANHRGELRKLLTILFHWVALGAASILVYTLHARLFRKSGLTPLRFWSIAFRAYEPILTSMTGRLAPMGADMRAYLR
jgi:hypothetical protein